MTRTAKAKMCFSKTRYPCKADAVYACIATAAATNPTSSASTRAPFATAGTSPANAEVRHPAEPG